MYAVLFLSVEMRQDGNTEEIKRYEKEKSLTLGYCLTLLLTGSQEISFNTIDEPKCLQRRCRFL